MDELENCQMISFPPVGEAESGQKLLRFLYRRLNLPESLLHRWLRTGQIRVNGKRSKPFALVQTGDIIRLPPFVRKLAAITSSPPPPQNDGLLPPLAGVSGEIWAFSKPAGLSVQGGINSDISLSHLLAQAYKEYAFIPAPSHRLDKDTSGLVLVGASFSALQKLAAWFASGKIHKEYLAWTYGNFPYAKDYEATHYLEGKDKVTAYADPGPGRCLARCVIRPLMKINSSTLLHIRLLTGCKRQLRAQLAALGTPIYGDSRYGAKNGSKLYLHAARIVLPDGQIFESLPLWEGNQAVTQLPEHFLLPKEDTQKGI